MTGNLMERGWTTSNAKTYLKYSDLCELWPHQSTILEHNQKTVFSGDHRIPKVPSVSEFILVVSFIQTLNIMFHK